MKEKVKELILRAQGGEDGAFIALKDVYRPLIEASSRKFTLDTMTAQDGEDVYQEALVHFCNSVCSYNCESEGVEFGLYAKICIENGLVSFLRMYNRQNRLRAVSLDERDELLSPHTADVFSSVVEREQTAMLVRKINKQLSPLENKVWWKYVSGASVASIADEIGIDRKSVSNAIYRIRKKLKNALVEQDHLS